MIVVVGDTTQLIGYTFFFFEEFVMQKIFGYFAEILVKLNDKNILGMFSFHFCFTQRGC